MEDILQMPKCPRCGKEIELSDIAKELGSKGGKAKVKKGFAVSGKSGRKKKEVKEK